MAVSVWGRRRGQIWSKSRQQLGDAVGVVLTLLLHRVPFFKNIVVLYLVYYVHLFANLVELNIIGFSYPVQIRI